MDTVTFEECAALQAWAIKESDKWTKQWLTECLYGLDHSDVLWMFDPELRPTFNT